MWTIKSADMMKQTQDRVQNPPSKADIDTMVSAAKDLGATHVAIAVPYDGPTGFDVDAQRLAWITSIRAHGMKVWHRYSWLSDQGWYGVEKNIQNDRLLDTKNWIIAHSGIFSPGDIFTPKPEPQNMGVTGINSGPVARFSSVAVFNKWLRDAIVFANDGLNAINIKDVKVGYYGFDGFVTCGYDNPDWTGKSFLEKETVAAMGNTITVDHYNQPSGKPMTDFLTVFKKAWPGVTLIEGEWGAIDQTNQDGQIKDALGALATDPVVAGVNYWHMGPGGNEALLNDDLTRKGIFDTVKGYFAGTTPVPTPEPTPTPETEPERIVACEGLSTIIAVTNKGNLWKMASGKWTKIALPKFE